MAHALLVGLRRFDCGFERGQRHARVARSRMRQPLYHLVRNLWAQAAKPTLLVRYGATQDSFHFIFGQRMKRQNFGAREERARDFEGRVLRGRAYERDGAVFYGRQERVLLRLVEAMNLVYEEDCARAFALHLARLGDLGAHVLDAGEDS
jgi:hypothetical protein